MSDIETIKTKKLDFKTWQRYYYSILTHYRMLIGKGYKNLLENYIKALENASINCLGEEIDTYKGNILNLKALETKLNEPSLSINMR